MPTPLMDKTGMRYGKLTVLARAPDHADGRAQWLCECECGSTKIIHGAHLCPSGAKSCGCAINLHGQLVHGLSKSPEYRVWRNMISRCHNPKQKSYGRYGGNGVFVCSEWRHNFKAFYEHLGPRPSPRHTLDRINSRGPYAPGNVRWATYEVQNNNVSRNIFVIYRGVSMRLGEAIRIAKPKIGREAIATRLRRGWSAEDALHEPPRR
jgi:hypothetical protein